MRWQDCFDELDDPHDDPLLLWCETLNTEIAQAWLDGDRVGSILLEQQRDREQVALLRQWWALWVQ